MQPRVNEIVRDKALLRHLQMEIASLRKQLVQPTSSTYQMVHWLLQYDTNLLRHQPYQCAFAPVMWSAVAAA